MPTDRLLSPWGRGNVMQYRAADSLGLGGHVSTLLMELIHERLGLQYKPTDAEQVGDRLAPLVVARGLASFMDFYYVLKYSPEPDDWLKVMDALAVQETYLWREIDQLRTVVDRLVPALVEAYRGRTVRIWSSACASGEEPLTIAMLLEEAGWFDRASIEVIASDASPMAIGRARKGDYTQRSFRNLPLALRDKYFVARDNHWSVVPELHRRVSYDVVNLVAEDQVARYASAPIILCRNVFIYFSDRSIARTVATFNQSMPSPAYLCVGVSESLLRRTSVFDLQEIGGAFVYVKGTSHTSSAAFQSGMESASSRRCPYACSSSMTRRTSARSSRRCSREVRRSKWSARHATAKRRWNSSNGSSPTSSPAI
jgi:chemotaxis protein methyltransferase CheR